MTVKGNLLIHTYLSILMNSTLYKGVINGKAGKAAKFSDTLTLSQPGGRLCPPIGFALPKV